MANKGERQTDTQTFLSSLSSGSSSSNFFCFTFHLCFSFLSLLSFLVFFHLFLNLLLHSHFFSSTLTSPFSYTSDVSALNAVPTVSLRSYDVLVVEVVGGPQVVPVVTYLSIEGVVATTVGVIEIVVII